MNVIKSDSRLPVLLQWKQDQPDQHPHIITVTGAAKADLCIWKSSIAIYRPSYCDKFNIRRVDEGSGAVALNLVCKIWNMSDCRRKIIKSVEE